MQITKFHGDHAFLSNFHPVPVVFEGLEFPSVEHAYQAAKTVDPAERQRFLTGTAAQAKRAGRKVTLRPDWAEVRLGVMERLVRQKFRRPELRELLLATGEAELVEGNHWNDTFWGVCKGKGENHLGRILMKVRAELAG